MIKPNSFLKKKTTGYFHPYYTGYGKPNNPNFLNTLKNTFDREKMENLLIAKGKVVNILMEDIPKIIKRTNITNWACLCVPRAKALKTYKDSQLMFLSAVSDAAKNIDGVIDGTNYIIRIKDTLTTHLHRSPYIRNYGDEPYPGITVATCKINQNIILVDDIYTKGVNIDEDCIQALLNDGVKKIVFYSVAYTRRNQ